MQFKLYVDDIRPAPEGWQQARTVTDAISFLYRFGEAVTEISLDHDISYAVEVAGTQRPFPSPETFMAVAYYIVEYFKGYDNYPKITLHSANPVGIDAMFKLFEDKGVLADIQPASRVNRLESEV